MNYLQHIKKNSYINIEFICLLLYNHYNLKKIFLEVVSGYVDKEHQFFEWDYRLRLIFL